MIPGARPHAPGPGEAAAVTMRDEPVGPGRFSAGRGSAARPRRRRASGRLPADAILPVRIVTVE